MLCTKCVGWVQNEHKCPKLQLENMIEIEERDLLEVTMAAEGERKPGRTVGEQRMQDRQTIETQLDNKKNCMVRQFHHQHKSKRS